MPGSVQNAAPDAVMAQSLCTAFVEVRAFLQLENQYHDGTVHRSLLAQTPRRSFKLGKRLTGSALDALKTFWDSHRDVPFFFYNPWEATPVGSNYDPDGNSTAGRYTVVFRGGWAQEMTIGRVNVPQIELAEVA
jgi:hypothetical protein